MIENKLVPMSMMPISPCYAHKDYIAAGLILGGL